MQLLHKMIIEPPLLKKKIFFHSTQSFSNDSSIQNYVQSLPVSTQGAEEKFDSSLSNIDASVKRSDILYVMEEIYIWEVIHSPSKIQFF